jgi:nucleoside-diphosphate-sugar epimerase
MGQTALVTGGSGFVASHLIDQLLAGGDLVHATVRSLANKGSTSPSSHSISSHSSSRTRS